MFLVRHTLELIIKHVLNEAWEALKLVAYNFEEALEYSEKREKTLAQHSLHKLLNLLVKDIAALVEMENEPEISESRLISSHKFMALLGDYTAKVHDLDAVEGVDAGQRFRYPMGIAIAKQWVSLGNIKREVKIKDFLPSFKSSTTIPVRELVDGIEEIVAEYPSFVEAMAKVGQVQAQYRVRREFWDDTVVEEQITTLKEGINLLGSPDLENVSADVVERLKLCLSDILASHERLHPSPTQESEPLVGYE